VVAGLAMVVIGRFDGISLVAVGALWASWIDYHKRPADKTIVDLIQRIEAMQSKINSLQIRIGMGGN
jgi:hypothetical protein